MVRVGMVHDRDGVSPVNDMEDDDTPAPGPIADAFALSRPTGPLTPVTYTCFQTWRMDTTRGAFFIKRLWRGADPHWWTDRAAAMEFERRVIDSGIATTQPINPVQPWFGYTARIGNLGVFRAYEWIDNRPLHADDDITGWVGETLALLHALEPPPLEVGTAWPWLGVQPEQDWLDAIAAGTEQGRPWASTLQGQLSPILDLSERLTRVWNEVDDQVISHGDFEPRNVFISETGPVLTDWESVAYESATWETARAAVAFGYRDPVRMRAILDSYRSCGGELVDLGDDLLLRSASLTLCHIRELLNVTLGTRPPAGWMDSARLDQQLLEQLHALPRLVTELTDLAAAMR